jgi:lipopolysaccharide/colanic/teichoic acid biosynthesis glycosyltransferase
VPTVEFSTPERTREPEARIDRMSAARGLSPAMATAAAGDGAAASLATVDIFEGSTWSARVALPDSARAYVHLVKPAFDRLVALVLILLLLPVLVAVAVAVRTGVGRGVVFRQRRIGLGGRQFTIYKFRTMTPDRRARRAPFDGSDRRRTHKHPADPRLTAVGRVLRAWSLDELPQLWNVLCGDMSLVGPRPELPEIVAKYEPWQHERHQVKPGLTGLWQVSRRGDGLMHEHVALDIDYLKQVRFRTDLLILLLTIPAALGDRRGH